MNVYEQAILTLLGRQVLVLHQLEQTVSAHIRESKTEENVLPDLIYEALWSLVGRGLASIRTQHESHHWHVWRTDAGMEVLRDSNFNPDDTDGFVSGVRERVGSLDDTVENYLREAAKAYQSRLYLSCVVMLGVASEASFNSMAAQLAARLQADGKGDKFAKTVGNDRSTYNQRLLEFRKLEGDVRGLLEYPLNDSLDLTLNSALELIRLTRNSAGHPTAASITRADCWQVAHSAARAIVTLHLMRARFT